MNQLNPVETFCAVWFLLSLFSLPIVAALLSHAKRGREVDGVGFVEEP